MVYPNPAINEGKPMQLSWLRPLLIVVTGWILTQTVSAQTNPWMNTALSPDQRANLLVAQMTLDEKITMVHGVSGQYMGNVAGNSRLGIPALHLQDGPAGVGDGAMDVTALPAPIALAASWDAGLARQYGAVMGAEARGKGVHVLLGPMMNMVRVPQSGRSFECFGEDPFLSAAIAGAEIQGIQGQGVIATAKHFAANEQETDRETESSDVDERTLQEIYYRPFHTSIRSGLGAVMGSFNRINGTYACESPLLNTVLNKTWGFDGFTVCDWGASFGTEAGANNGLDLEMPLAERFGNLLKTAVQSGSVPLSQLDNMVHRILAAMFRFGIFDNPTTGTLASNVTSGAHTQFARNAAAQGIVLLKNTGALLPLNTNAIHSVAVIGSAARENVLSVGTGSGEVYLSYYNLPFDAIASRAGPSVTTAYSQGDGGHIAQAVQLAQQSDIAIVCVGEQTGEGADRSSLSLPGDQDALINAVAAANPRTIVVLYAGAGTLMPWIGQIPAALVAWYPGQENGNALASVLFGDVNPSGKLPVTFPTNASQVPASTPAQFPGINGHVSYSEQLQIGYRWYDASNASPLFAFGHGLSYTTFAYSNLTVGAVSPSGQAAIGLDLYNIGNRAGSEVVQLYLGFPPGAGEPPRQLKGFKKVFLSAGATAHVNFTLIWEDLACWDSLMHQWTVPPGTFQVMLGASSRDIRLAGSFGISIPPPASSVANAALHQSISVSSILNTNFPSSAAADGDPTTRWSSLTNGLQWISVDLGGMKQIARVRLSWDTNYARSYQILVSSDNIQWTNLYTTTNGIGGLEDIVVTGSGRYVQISAAQSSSPLGYSLQEFEVYPPEPTLSITASGTNTFLIRWPLSWSGFGLQQNSDLNSSNWIPVTNTPTTIVGVNQVVLSATPGNKFYRLKHP
ncbi:MAG: Beta-glucosidase [Pedosphaera sp.]|nr:Beta-glucosidase [Pedosphaera sp.]